MKLRSGWVYPGNALRVCYVEEEEGYCVEAYLRRTRNWSVFVLGWERANAIKYYCRTVWELSEEEAYKGAKQSAPWSWLF